MAPRPRKNSSQLREAVTIRELERAMITRSSTLATNLLIARVTAAREQQ